MATGRVIHSSTLRARLLGLGGQLLRHILLAPAQQVGRDQVAQHHRALVRRGHLPRAAGVKGQCIRTCCEPKTSLANWTADPHPLCPTAQLHMQFSISDLITGYASHLFTLRYA